MSATRDQLLAPSELERIKVSVPEWTKDGHVYVTALRCNQLDELQRSLTPGDETGNIPFERMLSILVMSVCDDQGKLLFTADDIPALGEAPVSAIKRVVEASLLLNGLAVGEDEEIEGN